MNKNDIIQYEPQPQPTTQRGEIVLRGESSQLRVIDYSHHKELIDRITADVEPKLIIRPPIMLYGKQLNQPRDVGHFGEIDYKYSGQTMTGQPLTPDLIELLRIINEEVGGGMYNGVLVNRYNSGLDKIGAHSDDEREVDPRFGVIALSRGAQRIFRIRHKTAGKKFPGDKNFFDYRTRDYEIMIMEGGFQKEFTHEIPEEKTVKDKRLSLTFRHHAIEKSKSKKH